ncbi:AAA family ATPase [Nanoarchaeota archaeon]
MGKTIGVLSLKGGVGKTSVVAALGAAISSFDKKVLLIDGNFSAPNLGLHLNIVDPEITIHHVFKNKAHPRDAVYKCGDFDVVPAEVFNRSNINPLKLRDKIKFLKKKYDIILIDSSPALNEETLAVMLASDEILIVTTPDHSTMSTTLKAVKMAKERGVPIIGLVLNKVHNKDFELSIHNVEDTIDVPVMAVIPHDINVLKALSQFIPSTEHKPKSKASIEYKKLGAALIGQKYNPFKIRALFGKITPKRHEINREIFYESVFKK